MWQNPENPAYNTQIWLHNCLFRLEGGGGGGDGGKSIKGGRQKEEERRGGGGVPTTGKAVMRVVG